MLEFSELGPHISSDDIASVEIKYGHKFPDDYRNFLLNYNGGIPSNDEVEIESFPEGSTDIQVFFGLNRYEETENIQWGLSLVEESCKGKQLLPIACDSGGGLFCLKWINDSYDIVFLDVSGGRATLYEVASSFSNFLKKIHSFNE